MPEYQNWLLTEEDYIATLTLNRAHASNSLTEETLYELRNISGYLGARKQIWVVILQGQGKHFSMGIDLDLIQDRLDQSPTANRQFLLGLQVCLDAFELRFIAS